VYIEIYSRRWSCDERRRYGRRLFWKQPFISSSHPCNRWRNHLDDEIKSKRRSQPANSKHEQLCIESIKGKAGKWRDYRRRIRSTQKKAGTINYIPFSFAAP
jgi:hypothetical protein